VRVGRIAAARIRPIGGQHLIRLEVLEDLRARLHRQSVGDVDEGPASVEPFDRVYHLIEPGDGRFRDLALMACERLNLLTRE
jgi:hypothetical protein